MDDLVLTKHERGPTEIWTRIAGFKVQSANHYTMGPRLSKETSIKILIELQLNYNWFDYNFREIVRHKNAIVDNKR